MNPFHETDPERETVLKAAIAGDELSREQIIETCRSYLLAIAEKNLDDPLRAKVGCSDIVQEACIKANAVFGQFRGTSYPELLAWLRRTLVNELIDVRRKYKGSQVRNIGREVALQQDSVDLLPQALIDQELTPCSATDNQEQIHALRIALQQLTEEYRQVIIWRNWDFLSFAEIGERLGRTEEAARKLWNRAVTKLAEFLPPT
jgi:RNA polymerase sigma-70 factor, ECF subfamily